MEFEDNFWDETQFSVVGNYCNFGGPYCLYLQGGRMLLRISDNDLMAYKGVTSLKALILNESRQWNQRISYQKKFLFRKPHVSPIGQ
jgi:hypothetical protein